MGSLEPKRMEESAVEVGATSAAPGDASSQPPVEVLPPQAMEKATTIVILAQEAKVIVINNRSPDKEEGAEVQAEVEVALNELIESVHRQGKELVVEGHLLPYRLTTSRRSRQTNEIN
ncbi:uncharacterized protein A4U43_C10F9510 [Asparagus officinalis]|uniref:Uncharacterized protein n=1 Tax=Asparagus officinalis TaxID=4686 RepID=A0A5P1E674_ASPOF|nr:uncharacterized protein A4U43_C10F9510 [Asparagus officinalis]